MSRFGQVKPGVGGEGAVGELSQQPGKGAVGVGGLARVDLGPAEFGEEGVEPGRAVLRLVAGEALEEFVISLRGLGRTLETHLVPGAGDRGERGDVRLRVGFRGLGVGRECFLGLVVRLKGARAGQAGFGGEGVVRMSFEEGPEGMGGVGRLAAVEQGPAQTELRPTLQDRVGRLLRGFLELLGRAVELLGRQRGLGDPDPARRQRLALGEPLGELTEGVHGLVALAEFQVRLDQVRPGEIGHIAVGLAGEILLQRGD